MATETPDVPAGLSRERVAGFTDAILAIAITLLVLEIPRPGASDIPELAAFLASQAGSFFAFVITFLVLWKVWRAHHTLFDKIERLSRPLVAAHLPLLIFAVLLPYGITVFGLVSDDLKQDTAGVLAVGLLAANVAVVLLTQALLTSLVLRQRLYRPGADVAGLRSDARVGWAIGLYWAATAVGCAWIAPIVPYLWIASPGVGYLAHALTRPPTEHRR
ncbi:TMEM175 family protein [Nonomuraea lactucae]|uniref:TMEM175 family protein n=1 Tax=Nonomuraea lactucae TaxID=2249762 RepID=UPI0013B3AB42|nr:TMEM175 family protein [Nonomuraea lactucae]